MITTYDVRRLPGLGVRHRRVRPRRGRVRLVGLARLRHGDHHPGHLEDAAAAVPRLGQRLAAPAGRRRRPGAGVRPAASSRLTTIDGSPSYVDDRGAGRSGPGGAEPRHPRRRGRQRAGVAAARVRPSATRPTPPGFLFKAEWAGLATTTERVYSAPGAFRERRSRTTYNGGTQPSRPPPSRRAGWTSPATSGARSPRTPTTSTAGMVVYPAVNKKVAGACTSTAGAVAVGDLLRRQHRRSARRRPGATRPGSAP